MEEWLVFRISDGKKKPTRLFGTLRSLGYFCNIFEGSRELLEENIMLYIK
jgi:hypothetical protein